MKAYQFGFFCISFSIHLISVCQFVFICLSLANYFLLYWHLVWLLYFHSSRRMTIGSGARTTIFFFCGAFCIWNTLDTTQDQQIPSLNWAPGPLLIIISSMKFIHMVRSHRIKLHSYRWCSSNPLLSTYVIGFFFREFYKKKISNSEKWKTDGKRVND